ncbi:hypothetical protein C8Q80DRAFT_111139 [Daedaleopsis nitida]|nr:hypothetical protein C8Q80DRAFT_111139 [Daedaleopsis nitida]
MNINLPILKLPAEILHQILEHVPETTLAGTHATTRGPIFPWRSSANDVTMLIPFSLACRHFRTVALSHPFLWTTLILGRDRTDPEFATCLLARSGDLPLNVVLHLRCSPDLWTWGDTDMVALWPQVARRVRELQILQLRSFANPPQAAIWPAILGAPCPRLESFALNGNGWHTPFDTPFPLFQKSQVSNIRRFSILDANNLPKCHFPHLTHLAICGFSTWTAHSWILSILSRSPRLESLIISRYYTSSPQIPIGHVTRPLVPLRRIVLDSLPAPLLTHLLPMLKQRANGCSLQVLGIAPLAQGIQPSPGPPLTDFAQPITTVYIGIDSRNEARQGNVDTLRIAGTTPRSLVQLGTYLIRDQRRSMMIRNIATWADGILHDGALLLSVRDAWLANVTMPGMDWFVLKYVIYDFLAALSLLETVTIVVDRFKRPTEEPSLLLLPDGRRPWFRASRLKTVRIVQGYYDKYEEPSATPRERKPLRLSTLLAQVETGAYRYVDELELQVAPVFDVDEAELDRLRAHFSKVSLKYVDGRRAMMLPLPECAVEPEAADGAAEWNSLFYS